MSNPPSTPETTLNVPEVPDDELYGLMAEFDEPEQVLAAARAAYASGYRQLDAYSPIPVEGLTEALGQVPTRLPLLTFAGGVLGGLTGYGLQYYALVISYPMNVGGRPYHSWPAFIPVIFELTVLGAALFAVFGMLALNGLPMPYHPTFNVPQFKLASRNRFFLLLKAVDLQFQRGASRRFLEGLHPLSVHDVPK